MSGPLVTTDAEQDAQENLRLAWKRLVDVIHEPGSKHVLVSLFDRGKECSKCHGSWDGLWQSADGDVRLCHSCCDAVLSDVMGVEP